MEQNCPFGWSSCSDDQTDRVIAKYIILYCLDHLSSRHRLLFKFIQLAHPHDECWHPLDPTDSGPKRSAVTALLRRDPGVSLAAVSITTLCHSIYSPHIVFQVEFSVRESGRGVVPYGFDVRGCLQKRNDVISRDETNKPRELDRRKPTGAERKSKKQNCEICTNRKTNDAAGLQAQVDETGSDARGDSDGGGLVRCLTLFKRYRSLVSRAIIAAITINSAWMKNVLL